MMSLLIQLCLLTGYGKKGPDGENPHGARDRGQRSESAGGDRMPRGEDQKVRAGRVCDSDMGSIFGLTHPNSRTMTLTTPLF